MYELATYEKEPESVTNTPTTLANDFSRHRFECLVAEVNGAIAGMAIFHPAYSSWRGFMYYLDDIVVKESMRGLGIGDKLFAELLDVVKSKGANLLKWQVLDWNDPAINFYKKYDASIETNWWNGKLIF